MAPIEIFCCYAQEDQKLLGKLRMHLSPLEREGRITIWADTNISAGSEREHELEKHLNTAQIILLLISANFMASDYSYSKEMTRAIERHERGEARVIPIILRPIYWQGTPFGKLQALPPDGKPIADADKNTQDRAFVRVVDGINKVVNDLLEEQRTQEGKNRYNTRRYKKARDDYNPPLKDKDLVAFDQAINIYSETEEAAPSHQTLPSTGLAASINDEAVAPPTRLTLPSQETVPDFAPARPNNWAAIKPSGNGRMRSRMQIFGIITAVMLVIVVCGRIIFGIIYASNQTSIVAAGATSTAIAQVNAANIAQIDPNIARSNPDSYPPTTGRLTFYDPMSNQSNLGWTEEPGSNGSSKCQFSDAGYDVSTPANPGNNNILPIWACAAQNTDLSNFAFEVQMTIKAGDCGGIAFRISEPSANDYYEAIFCQDGSYDLVKSNSQDALVNGSTSLIRFGLGQSNIIAVVANGDIFNLYVNKQKIASVKDDSFSHGSIGVLAASPGNSYHPCDVIYHNAKVWTF
jgi:hypothetical protein